MKHIKFLFVGLLFMAALGAIVCVANLPIILATNLHDDRYLFGYIFVGAAFAYYFGLSWVDLGKETNEKIS